MKGGGQGGGDMWPFALLGFANNAPMPGRNRPLGVQVSSPMPLSARAHCHN